MRKLILALTLGAILLPNQGFSLGLGEIEVNSSLNQELEARIDLLSATPEDAETLIVKLASREEFIRAGLDRPLVVTTLKFKTTVEDDNIFIDVSTRKPVREPFLNFLVELDWPKGHLLREYTILLDPPIFNGQTGYNKTTASTRPAMSQASTAAPTTVQSTAMATGNRLAASAQVPTTAGSYVPAATLQVSYAATSDSYRIQEGDTAWSIANRMRPNESISTQQMLLAILRANPEAFINENVNGLKRGYILRMPDATSISETSVEQAKAAVREQNALWREYQQTMASDQPASALDDAYTETEYSSEVSVDGDSRLSIVSAGGGASAMGDMKDPSEMSAEELREQLALARERVETERVEKEALQQQVGSLSKQVDKMKGLLTVEDEQMAELQSAGMDDEAIILDETPADEEVVEEDVVDMFDEEQALDALDELTGDSGDTGLDESADITDEDALFVDETTEAVVETEAVDEQAMMDDFEPEPVPQQQAGLIDTLLNNRMILAGIGLLLLVVGAIVYLIKRRRSAEPEPETPSAMEETAASEQAELEDVADMIDDESVSDEVSDEEVQASMAEAEAEEEEFDAEATMILPSGTDTVVTSAAELEPEEEEEKDDVLAEADVYLAYGIYQQAEELLQSAIQQNPDKDAYRVKLAETYFAGKNAEAFAQLGAEMKARIGNEETPAWTKIVAMGKELCPEAEVFQQAAEVSDLDLDDMMPKSPEPMDFDLGEEAEGEGGGLDLDFDSPLEEPAASDEFELPSMEDESTGAMEETAIISPEDTGSESVDELEFDLGETEAIEEAPAEEAAVEEEFSLDIEASELDLDAGTSEAAEESTDVGMGLDLDMSMDTESEAEPATEETDIDLDMSMDMEAESAAEPATDEVMDLDLDMSIAEGGEDEEAEIDLTAELGDESLDDLAAGLDMSMDEGEAEEEAEIDLSADDSDLDLSMDDFGDVDLSEPADTDEISTKLDLARAYLDMGDNDGARDILDEVIATGNDGQKKEAEELLTQAG